MPDLPKTTSQFLTLPAVDGARTDYKDVRGSRVPGLMLRVSKTARNWVLVTRLPGRKNSIRLKLGALSEMSLTEARTAALAMKARVHEGHDPLAERSQRRVAAATARLDLIDDHIAKFSVHCEAVNRTGAKQARMLRLEVLPHWKGRHIATITRREVRELVEAKAETAPIMANRLLALVKRFFGWAVEQEIIERSPAAAVKKVSKEISRDTVLTDEQLLDVWSAAEGLSQPFGSIVRLLILTAQRLGEVAGMRWSELDLDAGEWVVSGARAKNGEENRVPLTDAAVTIIKDQLRIEGSDFVFPSGRKPAERSVSGFSKIKTRLDKESGVTGWRFHDLRRTAASRMARLRVAPHVIEKLLNHTTGALGGLAGVYNRFGYDEEKRHALETWAAHLERLATGEAADNVVPLVAVADA